MHPHVYKTPVPPLLPLIGGVCPWRSVWTKFQTCHVWVVGLRSDLLLSFLHVSILLEFYVLSTYHYYTNNSHYLKNKTKLRVHLCVEIQRREGGAKGHLPPPMPGQILPEAEGKPTHARAPLDAASSAIIHSPGEHGPPLSPTHLTPLLLRNPFAPPSSHTSPGHSLHPNHRPL